MKFKSIRHSAAVLLFGLITACGGSDYPPDDVAKLDLVEKNAEITHGLLEVTQFTINKRSIDARKRVTMHVTYTGKADHKLIEQYQEAQAAQRAIWGTIQNDRPINFARHLDGQKKEVTMYYAFKEADKEWQLLGLDDGHR